MQEIYVQLCSEKALVWSALIYGAEVWTLFKSDVNIMAAEMWIWRRMLGVSWKEKRTNASILSELDVKKNCRERL